MALRSNELMIGDYLTFPDVQNDSNCPKLRVIVVNEEDVYVSVDGDPVADLCDPKELAGIPITPEILEKNGFVETDVVVVGTRKMIWESEDGRTEITIWMDDTMPMHICKNIYYEDEVCYTLPFACTVHELQHALRLCGINKTIEL